MKIYKTIKNIASKTPRVVAIGIVAALPYVCESCAHSKNKIYAGEAKKEITEIIQEPSNLEIILKK